MPLTTLAFDTATPAPSLAIVQGSEVVERQIAAQVGAGRRVAEEIHALLVSAGLTIDDVDRIVVGVGPGGFTGIRIGISTALGLAQARGLPVVGASTLDTLALGMGDAGHGDAVLVPLIDARRNEVFTAAYRRTDDGVTCVAQARALPVAEAAAFLSGLGGPVVVAGDGTARIAEDVLAEAGAVIDAASGVVRAALAVRLADGGQGLPVTPIYLRLPDAEVNRRRRAVVS